MAQKTFTDSTEKLCPRCEQIKRRSEFGTSRFTLHGLSVYCRKCNVARHEEWRKKNLKKAAEDSRKWRASHPRAAKDHSIRSRYGLPLGGYERLLAEQGGKCACCGSSDPGGRGDFHVDHCHNTKAIRGLLCNGCNVGLGYFKHDPDRLRSAITYLTRS